MLRRLALLLIFLSIPSSVRAAGASVLNLRLSETVKLALANNAGLAIAHERVSEAGGRKVRAISELVPHLFGEAADRWIWRENLAAMGFPEGGLIGPFNTFDARIRVTEKIFDLSAVENARAGASDERLAALEEAFAREKVFTAAALAYIDAATSFEKLKAASYDLKLAQRLLKQAVHLNDAGLATGIDVARARTRAAEVTLALHRTRMEFIETRYQLERVAGLSFESRIRLVDPLRFFEEKGSPDEKTAIETARANRPELKISGQRIVSEEHRLGAAKAELLPTVGIGASYGFSGQKLSDAEAVGDVAAAVRVPIFEGGRDQGAIQEAASRVRQTQISRNEVARSVEEDVRLAVRHLKVSSEMVRTATESVALAGRQLAMARDRFLSGVSDNVEVLSAQTALANARQAYVGALARYHVARVNLYASLGTVSRFHLEA